MITKFQQTARLTFAARTARAESDLADIKHAARVASCAQGTGHVTIDSPICDACGHDVRRPAPRNY